MPPLPQAHGAWISFPPLPFSLLPPFSQNFHINHSFFKIFTIIRFSSFDNISRRHTSLIIRVFCVHSFSTFEKGMIYMKILKKGGGRRKRNPCPMLLCQIPTNIDRTYDIEHKAYNLF